MPEDNVIRIHDASTTRACDIAREHGRAELHRRLGPQYATDYVDKRSKPGELGFVDFEQSFGTLDPETSGRNARASCCERLSSNLIIAAERLRMGISLQYNTDSATE